MEKKRSKGVIILGIYLFVLASAWLLGLQRQREWVSGWVKWEIIISTSLFGFLFLFLGINILRLKKWARKFVIWLFLILMIRSIFIGPLYIEKRYSYDASKGLIEEPYKVRARSVALYYIFRIIVNGGIIIFFLTRPKVKEQFKQEE